MSSNSTKLTSLSVFLPCYNEADNLELAVEAFLKALPILAHEYELIIVNDGSQDQTGRIADALARKNPQIRVCHHAKNQGYGAALRTGYGAARFDWTFFTDGDLQFDPQELKLFLPYTERYSVIIGYRKKRAEGGLRSFNARLFKLYIDLLFRVHVRDIDCAFKLIKTNLVKSINFVSTGATINAELLYRLKKMHQPFKQIPVSHFPRQYGTPTGNNPKVIIKAGIESVKLYLALKFGFKVT